MAIRPGVPRPQQAEVLGGLQRLQGETGYASAEQTAIMMAINRRFASTPPQHLARPRDRYWLQVVAPKMPHDPASISENQCFQCLGAGPHQSTQHECVNGAREMAPISTG